jgi:hypothetical protein
MTPFGPKRAESTIGDYYDRIAKQKAEAWKQLQEHELLCPKCQLDIISDLGASCRRRRELREAAIDAGNTGD